MGLGASNSGFNYDDYKARTGQIESSSGQASPNVYQFQPGTWARLGGGNLSDPALQEARMQQLTTQNYQSLSNSLGRPPLPWELYLAHQQGAGGAAELLANPSRRAGDIVGDAAVKNNGGDPNAPASDFVALWQSKYNKTPYVPSQFAQNMGATTAGNGSFILPGDDALTRYMKLRNAQSEVNAVTQPTVQKSAPPAVQPATPSPSPTASDAITKYMQSRGVGTAPVAADVAPSTPPPAAPQAPATATVIPGRYNLGEGIYVGAPAGTPAVSNPPSNTINPYDPLATQLGNVAALTGKYWGGQVAGIPSAIASDWRAGNALTAQGTQQMAAGNYLPSFPSSDPRTWGAGGALNTIGGIGAGIASPVTGPTRQLVQNPVTQATGNPDAGERAGIVASSIALPALGRAAGALAGAPANAALGGLDPEVARLAQLARDKYNIPVNALQMSASPGLQLTGSAINRLPLSGAAADSAAQRGAWVRAVSNEIGEDSPRLTRDVMNSARTRIGGYYDGVAQRTTINADPQFGFEIAQAIKGANEVLPADAAKPVLNQAKNVLSAVDPKTGAISFEKYKALTDSGSSLDNLINSDDSNVARYAGQLKAAVDGALERSASPQDQALLKTADRQYWALKTIQPLAAKSPTGDISPALLAGRVNAQTGYGLAFGRGGNLGQLADIGQRFLKEPPSSGTPERLWALGQLSALVGAAAGAGESGLLPAAGAAALIPATLAAGRVGGTAMRSQWLSNQLINRSLRGPPVNAGFSPALAAVGGSASALNPSGSPAVRSPALSNQ